VVPTSFQTLRALRGLNHGAVGLALAGVAGGVLAVVVHNGGVDSVTSSLMGLPTLLCGLAWMELLRRPATFRKSTIRRGWVASIPLAMANAGFTFALLLSLATHFDAEQFLLCVLTGATLGAIVWVPALLATLVCFGLPIASAQRLAKKGLAGEERGESIVGGACVAMSAVGVTISIVGDPALGLGVSEWLVVPRLASGAGLALGLIATVLARARAARRRRFVADVAAGKIAGYRVDVTDEGKVLVRVISQGQGYRVADFEEDVFDLDADGEAKRPRQDQPSAAP
jgi:hypothetical protein